MIVKAEESVKDTVAAGARSVLCDFNKNSPKTIICYRCKGPDHLAKNCQSQDRYGKTQIRSANLTDSATYCVTSRKTTKEKRCQR